MSLPLKNKVFGSQLADIQKIPELFALTANIAVSQINIPWFWRKFSEQPSLLISIRSAFPENQAWEHLCCDEYCLKTVQGKFPPIWPSQLTEELLEIFRVHSDAPDLKDTLLKGTRNQISDARSERIKNLRINLSTKVSSLLSGKYLTAVNKGMGVSGYDGLTIKEMLVFIPTKEKYVSLLRTCGQHQKWQMAIVDKIYTLA
jgi:hypothetical protein